MAITEVPTANGFELVNTEWTDADRAFFAMLRNAGLPITFDVKQAFYQWRLSFGSPAPAERVYSDAYSDIYS